MRAITTENTKITEKKHRGFTSFFSVKPSVISVFSVVKTFLNYMVKI